MRYLRHEADCVAWPWVTGGEFARGSCSFDRGRALARMRERMKEHGWPELTPELVDDHWSHGGRLCAALIATARRRLVRGADAWSLAPDPELPGREILRWRYLSLALPPGMLVAAAADDGVRPPLPVDVLRRSFGPVGPVAHLHLHVGAACSFEVLWTHVMSRRTPLDLKHDAKLPCGWTPAAWTAWLVRAALARRVLALLGARPGLALTDALDRLFGRDDVGPVRDALDQLARGELRLGARLGERLLLRVATQRPGRWVVPRKVEDVWRNDPIDDGGAWPEGAMLGAAFTRVSAGDAGVFEPLLVQYLRVKCLLYRLLVHDPTDHGLDSFVHTYRQISAYRDGLDLVLPDVAMAERGLTLRALEVRTAPPDRVTTVRTMARDLEQAAGRDLEVGWIFHFIRDGRGKTTGEAYLDLYRRMRRGAARLRRALTLHPRLLATIRGLDIAGSERRGPLWLAVPFFHDLRALSRRLATAGTAPLQSTIHVGEDFRHLATGLRAVHEPLQWGMVQRGDRLGHALALGLDPAQWCGRNPRVRLPRWERMLDLAWMIRALEGNAVGLRVDGEGHGLTLARMRRELTDHLRAVLGVEAAPDLLVRLYGELFGRPDTMPTLEQQRFAPPAQGDPLHLAWLRLYGTDRQAALDAIWTVETASELPLLQALARELTRLVVLWTLAIEVNPSSNLLIAGFDHPLEQPIFRLHPLDPGDGVALPITLNADDPLTFSTCLADEYAYTWAAMVLMGGVAPGRAHAWLREASSASWRARFTLPPGSRQRVDGEPGLVAAV